MNKRRKRIKGKNDLNRRVFCVYGAGAQGYSAGSNGDQATTSRIVNSEPASSLTQQRQSQTQSSQEVKSAPTKKPVAEKEISETTEDEPGDAIVAAAEENPDTSFWNTLFVALGISSALLGSFLVYRHVRRRLLDR